MQRAGEGGRRPVAEAWRGGGECLWGSGFGFKFLIQGGFKFEVEPDELANLTRPLRAAAAASPPPPPALPLGRRLSILPCPPSLENLACDGLGALSGHPHPEVARFLHKGFAEFSDYLAGRAVHCLFLRRSLYFSLFHRNTLLNMHFKLHNPVGALHLFDHMPERNGSSWNTAISGCVRAGLFWRAFELFRDMRVEGVESSGFVLASLVTACNRSLETIGKGVEVHAFALKIGLMCDVYVGTALLHLYGSYGLVFDARRLFQEMPERNVVSWTALMVGLSTNGCPQEAIKAYHEMRKGGVACNENSFASVISSCGLLGDERVSEQIVGHVIVSGLVSEVSVANSLISLFDNLERREDAEDIFYRMKERDTISWNSMITLYSHEGMCREALDLFAYMRRDKLAPDVTTLSSLITACSCSDNLELELGRSLHALSIKNGLNSLVSVANTLINMYSVSGKYEDAEFVFSGMLDKDLISWNTMISTYAQSQNPTRALILVNQMLQEKRNMNHVTFFSASAACSDPEYLMLGKIIHSLVIVTGLQQNPYVGNALITMYSKCKAMKEANLVFKIMPVPDVVTYNALIGGHVENEEHTEAMQVFNWMRESGITTNYISIVNILGAFKVKHDLLRYGMPLHGYTISVGLESDKYVKNSLLTMYAKCGDLDSSVYIFDGLKTKTSVSWNAMIASKAHNGQGEDAIKLFIQMQHAGVEIDQFSLSGSLAASANLATVEEGKQLHALLIKHGFDSNLHVINATMDMYAKCGNMMGTMKMLPEPSGRSQQSWNIMISAYARYGCFQEAEETFRQMLLSAKRPDYVTFVSLLSACNHAGLVDQGLAYFKSMRSEFGVFPGVEHCVCMVDLLGRSGRLSEAEKFIEDMNVEPNDLIWRSLLSSSRTHMNLDLGRKAAQRLIELQPLDDSAYVLLSNVYATNGKWEDVDRLRRRMESISLKKRPACSWIKFKNHVNTFGIGDRTHPQSKGIYAKLEHILQLIKKMGYIVDTSFALHDTDEEQKEHNLWSHSEKLALAFGLLNMPEVPILRIFKNLRVCGDCHLVFKLVSKAFDKQIMLRDPYRFHLFSGGKCSCSDYW